MTHNEKTTEEKKSIYNFIHQVLLHRHTHTPIENDDGWCDQRVDRAHGYAVNTCFRCLIYNQIKIDCLFLHCTSYIACTLCSMTETSQYHIHSSYTETLPLPNGGLEDMKYYYGCEYWKWTELNEWTAFMYKKNS